MATQPRLVNKQFNTPIGLYSRQNIQEVLDRETQILANGAVGINFQNPDVGKPANLKNSAVLRMLEEEENRQRNGIGPGAKRVAWPPPNESGPESPYVQQNAVSAQGGPQYPSQTPGFQQNNYQAPAQQQSVPSNLPSHRPLKPLDVSTGGSSPLSSPLVNQSPLGFRSSTPSKGWAPVHSPVASPSQPSWPQSTSQQQTQQQQQHQQQYQQSSTRYQTAHQSVSQQTYLGQQYYPSTQYTSTQQSQSYQQQNQPSSLQYQQPASQQQYQPPQQQYQSPQQQYQPPQQKYQPPQQQYQPPQQQYQPPQQQYQPPQQQYQPPQQQYQAPPQQQYQAPPQQQYQAPPQQQYQAPPQQQYQVPSQQQYQPPSQQAPQPSQAAPSQVAPRVQSAPAHKPVEPPPSTITLRQQAPVSQAPPPLVTSQPATATLKGGKHLRGDLKWPPEIVKQQFAEENRLRLELAKGPAVRPIRPNKDYTDFFNQHALNSTYPGYKIPPGTQFYRPE